MYACRTGRRQGRHCSRRCLGAGSLIGRALCPTFPLIARSDGSSISLGCLVKPPASGPGMTRKCLLSPATIEISTSNNFDAPLRTRTRVMFRLDRDRQPALVYEPEFLATIDARDGVDVDPSSEGSGVRITTSFDQRLSTNRCAVAFGSSLASVPLMRSDWYSLPRPTVSSVSLSTRIRHTRRHRTGLLARGK
jgi:hypothetical protein